MFLVQKANISSHFRSTTKKSPPVPKSYQLAARSFDEKVSLHLKTLDLTQNSSNLSLFSVSAAISFLSTLYIEAEDQMVQISSLKSEADDFQPLYMDYSMKVLDLCNFISSAVHQLTDRRLLMNFSLRLLNFTDQMPSHEKLNKAKDALARSVNNTHGFAPEKGLRAKELLEEMAVLLGNLPDGKRSGGRDLIRRTFYGVGLLTVLVGSVLVAILFGETDVVRHRVPAEFAWADLVNGVFDQIKPKKHAILELDNVARVAVVVGDLLQVAVADGGDTADVRVRLEAGVKELASSAKKFCEGVDGLSNGVNGMFRTVLKTRNGRLDV